MCRAALTLLACLLPLAALGAEPPKIKALIIDGQNNHNWKATTPILKKALEDTGLFTVEVATAPAGNDPQFEQFQPKFSDYAVVVSNYNGKLWPKATQTAFVEYVKNGGGFVSVHAANNAFPEWPEYNRMIGLGGWGGRSEKSGPYVRFKDGQFVKDMSKGPGGGHGKKHAFAVDIRNSEHPITAGLPSQWMHTADELYDKLRGPAENMTVLATAFADRATGGTGEHEPMLMVIDYGKGRVFHTTLGHDTDGMACAGFQTTFTRGTEWAAIGKVTQKVPADFPTESKTSLRK